MVYRNRRIGDFLKELKLTEGRNTGFPTAFNALRENGSEMPSFEMDAERRYLTVRIPVHPFFLKKADRESSEYDSRILSVLGNRELNLTDLAKEMGYKGITKKLNKAASVLCKAGVLEKVYSENNGVVFRARKG